jgi:predicted MFS family arabinose efflux permease
MSNASKETVRLDYYIAWALCAFFYLYQYELRVFPNLMGSEIRYDFGINAEQFGLFGALTLYAYAAAQIPLGIIFDRVGIKKTVIASLLVCILSGYLITVTKNLYTAYFLRLVIGFGSASAFMAALKIASDYLPPKKRLILMGSTLTVGTLGVVLLAPPLLYTLELYGWRKVIASISMSGLILVILAFLVIPGNKKISQNNAKFSFRSIVKDLTGVMKNLNIWFYTMIAMGFYAPFSVLADLWGGDFIMNRFSIAQSEAAFFATLLYLGLAIGSLVISWISEKYNCASRMIFISIFIVTISYSYLIYGTNIDRSYLITLLIIIGFFCGAEMICFSQAILHCNPKNSGITIGFLNSLNISSAGLAQYLVGKLLDISWLGGFKENGSKLYGLTEYRFSFFFLVIFLFCCVLACSIKYLVNHKKQQS